MRLEVNRTGSKDEGREREKYKILKKGKLSWNVPVSYHDMGPRN
jgi:hypothetical protein